MINTYYKDLSKITSDKCEKRGKCRVDLCVHRGKEYFVRGRDRCAWKKRKQNFVK